MSASTLGTVLITGASTGIGAVYADRLASQTAFLRELKERGLKGVKLFVPTSAWG